MVTSLVPSSYSSTHEPNPIVSTSGPVFLIVIGKVWTMSPVSGLWHPVDGWVHFP